MTRERSDLDLGGVLGAWMNDTAPASVPVVVLEDAFARTMRAPQLRVYPWQRLARRSSRPRRLTLLSLAATARHTGAQFVSSTTTRQPSSKNGSATSRPFHWFS